MHLCLFEDRAERLAPLTLTRPVFDLHCGTTTLADKLTTALGAAPDSVLVRPQLEAVCRIQHPERRVNDWDRLRTGPVALVSGRWLPPDGPVVMPDSPCVGVVGDEVA